jgi:predicted anti-sigma-YlaC factor YlaD
MPDNHLNEADIQNYLDGDPIDRESRFDHHLKRCGACRNLLREYQILYDGLSREPDMNLSPSFAETVVSRVFTLKEKSRRWSPEIVVGAAGFVAACIAAIFLVNWNSVLGFLSKITIPKIELNSNLFSGFKILISGLNGHAYLVFFAVIALLTVAAADRLFLKAKQNKVR